MQSTIRTLQYINKHGDLLRSNAKKQKEQKVMATYKERVAALKKAGEETKRKHAEAKTKKKKSLFGKMKEQLKAKKVTKQKKVAGVKTGVQKTPKYKGAPEAPKTSKLGKQAEVKRKKAAADKSWSKAVKRQKKSGSGETLSSLVEKRKSLKKGSAEYAAVQNKINKAYGVKKRHKAESPRKQERANDAKIKAANKANIKKQQAKKEIGQTDESIGQSYEREEIGQSYEKYSEGGKVEANNPYGWPTRDARNGGYS